VENTEQVLLKRTEEQVWRWLIKKEKLFSARLDKDGSFWCTDEKLAWELRLSTKSISRVIHKLIKLGIIRVVRGKYCGDATKYWILKRPTKRPPFRSSKSPTNKPEEPDNGGNRARQEVHTNHNIDKDNNKAGHLFLPVSHFMDVYKESNEYFEASKQILIIEGYTEFQIEEAYRNSGIKPVVAG
jgi:hypothetical protein